MPQIKSAVLKSLRERKGWSQEELAEKTRQGGQPKIDKQTISRLERGEQSHPRGRTIRQLARALGVEQSVLTGDSPMPEAQIKGNAKDSLQTLIGTPHHNALYLVASRYHVGIDQIIELAPFLFWCAAEASLQERRDKIGQLEQAYLAAQNLERSMPHLPDHEAYSTTDEIVAAEKESIEFRDIFGLQLESYNGSDDTPFERFLRQLAREIDDEGTFEHFSLYGPPEYTICAAEAAHLLGEDTEGAKEVLEGSVSLSDLPDQIQIRKLGPEVQKERAAWVKTKAAEYKAQLVERLTRMREREAAHD